MATRRTPLGPLVGLALIVSTTACVDTFDGAFVAIDFRADINESLVDAQTNPAVFGERRGGVTGPQELGVLLQHTGADPQTLTPGQSFPTQPPPNTHYELHWVQRGTTEDGDPSRLTFKALDFEIVPIVDLFDPCLIDDRPTDYPGIHVASIAARLADDLGFGSPTDPATRGPDDPIWDELSDDERAAIFDANRRISRQQALTARVLAVTSHDPISPAIDIGVDTTCANDPASDPGLIPPQFDAMGNPVCFDDESNQRRLELCTEYFDDNPTYYAGNDRVLTLPVAGDFFGTVYSLDPRFASGVGRFLGANVTVDADMDQVVSLLVKWQFDDDDGDGEPDPPDGFTAPDDGVVYLAGDADESSLQSRGAIIVQMENPTAADPFLTARASIQNNLNEDEITF